MIEDTVSDGLFSFVSIETQKTQTRRKNSYKALLALQKEILESHRIICLLPYYIFVSENRNSQVPQLQTYLPKMTDSDLILSLLQPKKMETSLSFTLMIQESIFLINYLKDNSIELAREVVKAKTILNVFDFYHLIFQIIPSIFGFYHSQEHLNLASIFYQNAIDFISENLNSAIRILQPLFNSPTTYRYIEFVMTKIYKKMLKYNFFNKYSNIPSDDKKSNLYKEYVLIRNIITKKFLFYLTKGVSLLPSQILKIFKRIKIKHNDKWTIHNWYKLIFSIFIGPHFKRWSRSHFLNTTKANQNESKNKLKRRFSTIPQATVPMFFYSNVGITNNSASQPNINSIDIIDDILTNILNDIFKRDFDLFIESLCTTESTYCLPQMYQCFDKCAHQYQIVANDLVILVKFMKDRNILPSFINMSKFEGFSEDALMSLLILNIYQNDIKKKQIIEKPVAFPKIKIDPEFVKKYEEQNIYKSNIASIESYARKENKNVWKYVLEKSSKDPIFHKYAENYIHIQYSKATELFEEFIDSSRYIKEIEKWKDIVLLNLNSIYLAYLNQLRKITVIFNLLPNKVKFMIEFQNINEDKYMTQYKFLTNKLDDYISDLLFQKQRSNLYDVKIEYPIYFFKASFQFSLIKLLNLQGKYNVFITFLKIINNFFPKNDNFLFLILLKQISASELIKILIEISTFAIYNEKCSNFISKEDIAQIQKFENLVYETFSGNYVILQDILKSQVQFQNYFAEINCSSKKKSSTVMKRKIFSQNQITFDKK